MNVITQYCRIVYAVVLAFVLINVQKVQADLIITSDPGVTHEASAFSNFAVTAADMVGLEVMVYFEDGTTDLGIWTANGVTQNNWSLTIAPGQSTFSAPFDLENNTGQAITRFSLHGAGTTTLFDRSVLPGTPESGLGRDLQEFTFLRFFQDITVTYFDEVRFAGRDPEGDLFAGLDVSFSTGLFSGGSFRFRTDTDNTVDAITAVIPEPSCLAQFGVAFLAIIAFHRRR